MMVFGSGTLIQDSFAADPEFTAYHFNRTTTVVEFSEAVNGTMAIADWTIKYTSTGTAGDVSSDVAISDVNNGTKPSAGDITASTSGSNIVGLGYMNDSTTMYLRHASIPTDATYYVNFTGNPLKIDVNGYMLREARVGSIEYTEASREHVEIGSNATAKDWIAPEVTRAYTTSDKTIEIHTTEGVANINATGGNFEVLGSKSGDLVGRVDATNGTAIIYLTMSNPIDFRSTFTISYDTAAGTASGITSFISDDINTDRHSKMYALGALGHGNQMANFTGLVIENNVQPISEENCFDCRAPELKQTIVSISGDDHVIDASNPLHINAAEGDNITFTLTFSDNKGASTMPFAGIYTNFNSDADFDTHFYKNNFDSATQMSSSYYEWNTRSDDLAYSADSSIAWTNVSSEIDTMTNDIILSYTMTIEDSMESSEIWIDVTDASGNYLKQALPVTLEVSGEPSLTFASSDNQKVTSFFNESVLLAIIGAFDNTSDNTSELSSALGIEDGALPSWTTQLASWAVEDKIDVADMVIAVEYVINQ
jgi:hypothetical protein